MCCALLVLAVGASRAQAAVITQVGGTYDNVLQTSPTAFKFISGRITSTFSTTSSVLGITDVAVNLSGFTTNPGPVTLFEPPPPVLTLPADFSIGTGSNTATFHVQSAVLNNVLNSFGARLGFIDAQVILVTDAPGGDDYSAFASGGRMVYTYNGFGVAPSINGGVLTFDATPTASFTLTATAVPEPASISLAGAGTMGLVMLIARRRMKRKSPPATP